MALTQVTSAGLKDGEIVNADLHSAAAIAVSKLSGVMPLAGGTLTGSLTVNGDVLFDNGTNANKDILFDASANKLEFSDDVIASFGNAGDLQIHHVNAESANYITSKNNVLYICGKTGQTAIQIVPDAATDLRYAGGQKLITTSLGARVVGDLQMGNTAGVRFHHAGTTSIFETQTAGDDLLFKTTPSGGSTTERLRITPNGAVCINNDTALSDLHICTAGSSEEDGTLRIGGSGMSLGLVLDYDQASATVSRITANPTYSNDDSLLKICVDGDANPNQLVLRGDGNIGIGINDTSADLQIVGSNSAGLLRVGGNQTNGVGLDISYDNSSTTTTTFKQNYRATNAGALIKFDSGYFTFHTGAAGGESLRIDSSGRVLIGLNANHANASIDDLQVGNPNSSTQRGITIGSADECAIAFSDAGDARAGSITYNHGSNIMIFKTEGQNERLSITSEKLSVGGKTSYAAFRTHNNRGLEWNLNAINSPQNHSSGISGWVFLGHDYGAAPYPVRTFKIAVPEGNAQGTRVYQVWHDGDANYDYGGLWEIRINQWTSSARFESVAIRCINGKRDDMAVRAYNNSNGIMIRPSTIWGKVYIRLAGYDDNQGYRGSSYCAVANNGALAIYNGNGGDDGTVPTGGSPVDVYPFDGHGGSYTGGRDIENSNWFNG